MREHFLDTLMPSSEVHIPVAAQELRTRLITVPAAARKAVVQLKRLPVGILEMEDVLFHLNSAVMMPENPEGPSATDGPPTRKQVRLSGILALAIAFKQVQLHPDRKLLVAGHTDRSGETAYNFDLSRHRAHNVMHLLKGGKEEWAEISRSKHKVEDYQQIMLYFSSRPGWNCNPGKVDNTWGPKTETATRNFIEHYASFAHKLAPVAVPAGSLVDTIKDDPKHEWPEPLWGAVYDLYQHELVRAVTGKHTADEDFEGIRNAMAPMDPARPVVGCGESFPISKRSDYRSQKDRRVEIMFFDTPECIPLSCPERTTSVHTKSECILHNEKYFKKKPLDPDDYFTAQYHLKFLYFDLVYGEYKPVPDGLPIKMYKDGDTEVHSRVKYDNGLYEVSGLGLTHTPREKNIHFGFALDDAWILTKDSASEPRIMTGKEIEKEISPKTFDELTVKQRRHYVSIAPEWDSRNWPCECKSGQEEFAEQVMRLTSAKDPIVFNMDMLVLLEKKGASQAIKDADHFDAPGDLEKDKSRVKILIIDPKDATLSLYKTGTEHATSRIPFTRNRVTEKAKYIACVFFRNGFYVPSDTHTAREDKWLEKGYCIGARAALRVDPSRQAHWEMYHNQNEHAYTGDYDVHYLHHLHALEDNPVSYAIVYVSISFMRDSGAGPTPIPSQADVDKFVNEGVYAAMARYNDKRYFFEEQTPGKATTIIKPFYFFDERETFLIPPADQPTGIDFDDYRKASVLMKHTSVTRARRAARGGKPKFLALVITDSSPGSNDGDAYQWSIRDNSGNYDFSIFQLHQSAWEDKSNNLPGVAATEYGTTYGGFTFAHELGHATSLADEYLNEEVFFPNQSDYPRIGQFFEQYTMKENTESLMYHMGPPRQHHLWYQVHSINNQAGGGKLKTMLAGKAFRVKYDYGTGTMIYHRPLTGTNAANKDIRTPDKVAPQYEVFKSGNVLKRLYLALYYVGQDESSVSNFHAGQSNCEYNGVICVRVFLNFKFTGSWTDKEKNDKMADFKNEWDLLTDESYRLVNGKAPLEKIYLHFLIGYTIPGESDVGQSNYELDFQKKVTETSGRVSIVPNLSRLTHNCAAKVKYDMMTGMLTYRGRMTNAHHKDLQTLFTTPADRKAVTDIRDRSHSTNRIPNNSGTLIVLDDVGMSELVLYMFNMDHGDNELTAMKFIKKWADNQTGNAYKLEYI